MNILSANILQMIQKEITKPKDIPCMGNHKMKKKKLKHIVLYRNNFGKS